MDCNLIFKRYHAKYFPSSSSIVPQNRKRLLSCGSTLIGFSITRTHHSFLRYGLLRSILFSKYGVNLYLLMELLKLYFIKHFRLNVLHQPLLMEKYSIPLRKNQTMDLRAQNPHNPMSQQIRTHNPASSGLSPLHIAVAPSSQCWDTAPGVYPPPAPGSS